MSLKGGVDKRLALEAAGDTLTLTESFGLYFKIPNVLCMQACLCFLGINVVVRDILELFLFMA